jgi:hypothetical protein
VSEQSRKSIVIDADPASVMAVIADFANYPSWATSVKRAEVLETGPDGRARRVAFTLDAGILRDQYELSYVWTGSEKVEWTLVSGQLMRAQEGSYALRAQGNATHVTYSLSVDLAIPMLGMLKRKGERMVMDQALNELKKRVESAP